MKSPMASAASKLAGYTGFFRGSRQTDEMGSVRFLTDEQLLAQCRVDHYRGSGPGGQKRNKTSNAVRMAHLPTGVSVTATESRSTGKITCNAFGD